MSLSTLFLMYHAILAPGESAAHMDAQERLYAVQHADWCAQLDAVKATREFHSVLPPVDQEGVKGYDAGHGICLTFDDAWKQHLAVAAPNLIARKLKAVFFITTGQVAKPHMLLWRDVRELAEMGFAIGSHGASHCFLTSVRGGALREELAGSKKALEDGLGAAVHFLSLPGGRHNEHVTAAAQQAGYRRIFTSTPGLWQEGLLVPRVAVRAGATGTRTVSRLLSDPFAEAAALSRRAAVLAAVRRLTGDRLYHWLHGLWARS